MSKQVLADTLRKGLEAALRSAGKDKTRPHLACVHVELGELVRLVGTDGHRAMIVDIDASGDSDTCAVDLSLPGAKGLVRILKTLRGQNVQLSASGGQLAVIPERDGILHPDCVSVRFPPYEQVIPADRKPVGIDAAYFADAAASAAALVGKKARLNLDVGQALEPIKITGESDGVRLTAVIMPRRPT